MLFFSLGKMVLSYSNILRSIWIDLDDCVHLESIYKALKKQFFLSMWIFDIGYLVEFLKFRFRFSCHFCTCLTSFAQLNTLSYRLNCWLIQWVEDFHIIRLLLCCSCKHGRRCRILCWKSQNSIILVFPAAELQRFFKYWSMSADIPYQLGEFEEVFFQYPF